MPTPIFDVRASSLNGVADCELRSIADQFPSLIEDAAGVAPRKRKPHIGTAMGSALHNAVRHVLTTGTLDGALDIGKKALAEEVKEEFIEDDVTKDVDMAHAQMERMLAAWYPLSKTYQIAFTELNLGKPEKPGEPDNRVTLGKTSLPSNDEEFIEFLGSGHIDVVTLTPSIIDHKFGKNKPNSIIQMGFYSMLLRTKMGQAVKGLEQHWTPRRTLKKEQPEPEVTEYNVSIAERLAWGVKERIKRTVTELYDGGDIYAVPANPMSKLCSEKFCLIWGTDACKMWTAPDQ
jgi:hypothetical protein